jgi:hypothetical protein
VDIEELDAVTMGISSTEAMASAPPPAPLRRQSALALIPPPLAAGQMFDEEAVSSLAFGRKLVEYDIFQ